MALVTGKQEVRFHLAGAIRLRHLQNFAWIHDATRIKKLFELLHPLDAHFALGVMQSACLHGTYTMFS